MIDRVYNIIDEVRHAHAPDPRTDIFDVNADILGSALVLTGFSSVPSAIEMLMDRLRPLDPADAIRDEIVRLPTWPEEVVTNAVVTAAAAPMLAGPIISEMPLSQIPMGHGVMILRELGRWLQCRAADGNLGWIHRGYLRREAGTAREFKWDQGAAGVPHVSLGCEIVGRAGELFYRLPWGALIERWGEEARLPDGTTGLVRGETVPISELPGRYPLEGGGVVATARRWRGTPYLWGGVTTWGADCSGLVQAAFRMHGLTLPRDSDQQAGRGREIDPGEGFTDLRAGDLLFFAEQTERISHVAISTGQSGIIHSALGMGGVAENDLLAGRSYEEELRAFFVFARRVIPQES